MSEETSGRKKPITLHGTLDQRVRDLSARIKMDHIDVVNYALDGFVQAVESNDVSSEMTFVTACRSILKKPSLTSELVFDLLSIGNPKLRELRDEARASHNRHLVELLSLNRAPLTPELLALLQEQADMMNQMESAREKEMEKAKKSLEDSK